GMDIGTAFGGMGSSREMTIASLAEPAMLMAVFTLAMSASTTNLSDAIDYVLSNGLVLRPSFLFALAGLLLVAVAECGRIPIDNPATHLELTMVHEAMILEYSGRYLALIEWAGQLRLMLYGVLIANMFLPWGIAENFTPMALAQGAGAIAAKLMGLGVILAVAETLVTKMRLFKIQGFLGFAYMLSLLGMLSHIILEVG
ncbi:MAG: formate hydrogenlyase, partial [Methylococcaceae bacterium]